MYLLCLSVWAAIKGENIQDAFSLSSHKRYKHGQVGKCQPHISLRLYIHIKWTKNNSKSEFVGKWLRVIYNIIALVYLVQGFFIVVESNFIIAKVWITQDIKSLKKKAFSHKRHMKEISICCSKLGGKSGRLKESEQKCGDASTRERDRSSSAQHWPSRLFQVRLFGSPLCLLRLYKQQHFTLDLLSGLYACGCWTGVICQLWRFSLSSVWRDKSFLLICHGISFRESILGTWALTPLRVCLAWHTSDTQFQITNPK